MAEYSNTVLACAGVLTIKQAAVVLWTVRARIMSGTINFKEEANNLFGPAFSVVLTSIPGTGTKETVEISERVTLNNATNEPLFLALALAGGITCSTELFRSTFAGLFRRQGSANSRVVIPFVIVLLPVCLRPAMISALSRSCLATRMYALQKSTPTLFARAVLVCAVRLMKASRLRKDRGGRRFRRV